MACSHPLETELLISLSVEVDNGSSKSAQENILNWLRGFPFAASLPVQPLSYTHTKDGINLVFRRKPSEEKGSKDGGIQFTVTSEKIERDNLAKIMLVIEGRRDSEGQVSEKIMSFLSLHCSTLTAIQQIAGHAKTVRREKVAQ